MREEHADSRSLAAAAVASDDVVLARSFRMHRPRGAFCHQGWCQQCRVTLDDGRVVLACQTSAGSAARARVPARTLAGRLAEKLPPWFYEHRFLRPRFLRQWYLARLRRLSGAPEFPAGPPRQAVRYADLHCDCLVVGGGRTGLAAAAALAGAGKGVVLVEVEQLGGSARFIAGADADAADAVQRTLRSGVIAHERTLCVAVYRSPHRALCVKDDGSVVIRFDQLVVATGSYDQLPLVPGNDLPGIVGLRAFERLAHQRALPAAARIGVYGSAADVERAVRCADQAGIRLAWIAGPGELPSVAPVVHRRRGLTRITGRDRATGVVLDDGDVLPCDLLVAAFSRPASELEAQWLGSRQAAGEDGSSPDDDALIPLEQLLGAQQGVGEGERDVHAHSGAMTTPISPPQPLQDEAMVCLCEDVRVGHVRRAIADGYRDVELVKRHTGCATGPCQGKLCHASLLQCLREAGLDERLPTPRPFARPMPLALFAGHDDV